MRQQTNGSGERFDLKASRLSQQAPVAEVFAIVVQKIVMALSQPRARTPYDVASTSLIRSRADLNGPIPGEVLDSDFLDAAPRVPD
jgi:hypothetical protein